MTRLVQVVGYVVAVSLFIIGVASAAPESDVLLRADLAQYICSNQTFVLNQFLGNSAKCGSAVDFLVTMSHPETSELFKDEQTIGSFVRSYQASRRSLPADSAQQLRGWCRISQGFDCAATSAGCIAKCKARDWASCIGCFGQAWLACCPCLQSLIGWPTEC